LDDLDALFEAYRSGAAGEEELFTGVLAAVRRRCPDEDAASVTVVQILAKLRSGRYREEGHFSRYVAAAAARNQKSVIRSQRQRDRQFTELDENVVPPSASAAFVSLASVVNAIDRRLCGAILAGHTLAEAARSCGIDRRTAGRRLRKLGDSILAGRPAV
jgi:transcriptional regulator with GAF, ATPase, and Fis domain